MTIDELMRQLVLHDDGVLTRGAHHAGDRAFCALEFDSLVRGRPFSDAPITLPDLRPLNDGPWSSDAARTAALLPVMVALWDWSTWSTERQRRWATIVVIETARQIINVLPGLTSALVLQCHAANNLHTVQQAAAAAVWAAKATVRAAVWVVAETKREMLLHVACALWARAAAESETNA